MIKFSIIVPAYNAEKYIEQAIESVIKQKYENWELIIVDDGSTDKSGVICDQYAAIEDRIKVIHTENRGEFISRITGMEAATGDYLLGCDADDYLELSCLETLNRVIECTGVDVIIYKFSMFGEKEGEIGFPLRSNHVFEASENILAVLDSTNYCLWNKAIKANAVKKAISGMTPQRFDICADYALIIPILCNTINGCYIDEILYNYRVYGLSMSHNVTAQHMIDIENSTRLIVQVLREHALLEPKMLQAVYNGYLKALSGRCNILLRNGKLDHNTVEYIHASELYANSKHYERYRYFSFFNYAILKIFRYKLFWIFKMFLWVKSGKQKVMNRLRRKE